MKIQVNLPEDLNKALKHDKINYELPNIRETLIKNLREFYKLKEKIIK